MCRRCRPGCADSASRVPTWIGDETDGHARAVDRATVSSCGDGDADAASRRSGSSRHVRASARPCARAKAPSSPPRSWPPTIPIRTISFTGTGIRRWSWMRCACCSKMAPSAPRRSSTSRISCASVAHWPARWSRLVSHGGVARAGRRGFRQVSAHRRRSAAVHGDAVAGRNPRQSGWHARHLQLAPSADTTGRRCAR